MKPYPKIQTVFKRQSEKPCAIILGEYSTPEIDYLKDCDWIWTEKVDGTNIRVMWDGTDVRFGGKTDNAQLYTGLYDHLRETFPVSKMAEHFSHPVCLYGEGHGAKIQKNGGLYKSDGQDFVLFDVLVGEWWLQFTNVVDIANKLLIKSVPIVSVGPLRDMENMVRNGFKSAWGAFPAEGIVARPNCQLLSRDGKRIITKLKHRDFRNV